MIKNIVFDVGRVLVQWEPEEAMKELGFPDKAVTALNQALFGTDRWSETDRGILDDDELLALFIAAAPEYEREIRLLWDNVDLAIRQFPYAKEWITACKKSGYGVYILSNYGRHTYEKTKKELDFVSLVDGAVFSYEVQQVKPDKEIYQTLCRRYGLMPEECVFIDDTAANVEAAKEAGMKGILFTGLEDAKEQINTLAGTWNFR